jgi:hypothetical protein
VDVKKPVKKIEKVTSKSQLNNFKKGELVKWAIKNGIKITVTKKKLIDFIWEHLSESETDSEWEYEYYSESESESDCDYESDSESD